MSNDDVCEPGRRRFLLCAAVGACAALIHCGGGPTMEGGIVEAGAVTDYPEGTIRLVVTEESSAGDYGVIVARDAGGIYAFSNTCTHQGYPIPAPDSLSALSRCPSGHGSSFDSNGAAVGGPAPRGLPHYAVSIVEGTIQIDRDSRVNADARTVVDA
jgi:Rieske Fe-S protein